ncbi:MAG: phenylalanine--tRNA ligase subunit beta [Polyangiaceae bacterium]
MKASLSWLRALVPSLPDDPKKVAALFTGGGLEVEGIETYGSASDSCVVVAVTALRPHPKKEGLRLVTVDRGTGSPLEVVCGAPNVPEPGGLVVLAPLGASLPAKGVTIEKRAIAGVESEGMLCSESELGLGDSEGGILILPPGTARPGTPLSKAVPESKDFVFEIGLTPNRPDGLGHVGLAREAAALLGVPFAAEVVGLPEGSKKGPLASFATIRIEDPERCPHYGAVVVEGVTVAPSPPGIRFRLQALGVRSISNVVDVTNLAMLEFGHPLHAFDLDEVGGKTIVVRRARAGEPLRTLDGVDRKLDGDDLVIADANVPVALAGVMGGGNSEVTAKTKRVLFEVAYFDARGVRRAARRHGMHTESSHRFERGVDHGDTTNVLARAASLTTTLAGGTCATAAEIVVGRTIPKVTVDFRANRPEAVLGIAVSEEECHGILARLGLFARKKEGEVTTFEIPTHRPDLLREIDLVEEIARVRGMDSIPSIVPAVRPCREGLTRESMLRSARDAAVELGFSEALTFSFVTTKVLDVLGAPAPTVHLANPLSEAQAVMRTSILPGLLESVARARRHGEGDVRLFTVGTVFLAGEGTGPKTLPKEVLTLGAVWCGHEHPWLAHARPVDTWDLTGLAEGLVARLVRRSASIVRFDEASRPSRLHPRSAARIVVDGKDVGTIGALHPDVVHALDVGGPAFVLELDVEALFALGVKAPRFRPIPRFPASTRDMALVVHDDVPAGDVAALVREAAGDLAENVVLFDKFSGGKVPEHHASLAFRVVYRAEGRTLTDVEVDERHAKVFAAVSSRFGATLRA